MISGYFCLHHIGGNCVCPPLAAGFFYLGTWLPSKLIDVVLVRNWGMDSRLAMPCVPQKAAVLMILFGYNPFEIIAHIK